MEPARFGLSPEERERLTPKLENEEKQDLTFSLLAFIIMLLLCAMIAVTLLIVRSRKLDSGNRERSKPLYEAITLAQMGPPCRPAQGSEVI